MGEAAERKRGRRGPSQSPSVTALPGGEPSSRNKMGGLVTGRPTYSSYQRLCGKSIEDVRYTRKSVFCTNTYWLVYTISHLEKTILLWYLIDTKKHTPSKGIQNYQSKSIGSSQWTKADTCKFKGNFKKHPLQVIHLKRPKAQSDGKLKTDTKGMFLTGSKP